MWAVVLGRPPNSTTLGVFNLTRGSDVWRLLLHCTIKMINIPTSQHNCAPTPLRRWRRLQAIPCGQTSNPQISLDSYRPQRNAPHQSEALPSLFRGSPNFARQRQRIIRRTLHPSASRYEFYGLWLAHHTPSSSFHIAPSSVFLSSIVSSDRRKGS